MQQQQQQLPHQQQQQQHLFDPTLNNSVFDDPSAMTPVPVVGTGAPRAMFDDEENDPSNEPPPLIKRTSRPTLGAPETRGIWSFTSYFLLHCALFWLLVVQ